MGLPRLVVTAFVIAPIGVAIQGGSAADLVRASAPIEYVVNNGMLNVFYYGIGGTPRGIPYPGVWNGSIWTLLFELLCYIGVAGFGVVGLIKQRWFLPAAFGLASSWMVIVSYPSPFEPQTFAQACARFAVMFLAGALLYQFRDVTTARWALVMISAVIVLAAGLLPNYRVVAAIPLAYAIIVSGALFRHKRLTLRNDLSYGMYIYAFPTQQLLAMCGLGSLNPFLFFVLAASCTLPLAALSWFGVEKHAISLKSLLTGRAGYRPDTPMPSTRFRMDSRETKRTP